MALLIGKTRIMNTSRENLLRMFVESVKRTIVGLHPNILRAIFVKIIHAVGCYLSARKCGFIHRKIMPIKAV